jgi:hypothetical protein
MFGKKFTIIWILTAIISLAMSIGWIGFIAFVVIKTLKHFGIL